ncbi:hypothetical protein, partial [Pedobacter sp.]|uniref:hypothetical protein n=1 Tax=Pedobacter sp. TaxID=1411316 RepID=UPI003C5176F1
PKGMRVKQAQSFIIHQDGKIKILRTVFHYRLLNHLEVYAATLRQDSRAGQKARKNFARKMDHLFDFAAEQSFNWWV